jgi:uncharacterized membrane-anchored protein YitT (DUF2179 family)
MQPHPPDPPAPSPRRAARRDSRRALAYSVPWNLLLITMGALIAAFGVKALAAPQGFISGGMSGVALLCYYTAGTLPLGVWNLLVNIPIFVLGWFLVSRRFFLYSLYGMLAVSLCIWLIPFSFPIQDRLLAAGIAGAVIGAGLGIAFRSLGSTGGVDILAVILHQRFALRLGQVSFAFNLGLFTASMSLLVPLDVLYSLALVFVSAQVTESFQNMFNQRKMVLVISERSEEIADAVMHKLHRGSTWLSAQGVYTGRAKKVLLTIVPNIQLKRLEEIIFSCDPEAFTIMLSTFNVLGWGFSRRKVY